MNPNKCYIYNQTGNKKKSGTHTHTHNHNCLKKGKYEKVSWWAKETKNGINQLKTKLTKTRTGEQNQSRVTSGEQNKENKVN